MKRLFPFLCLISLLASCERGNPLPASVLPPDKMEPLLWELMQADQFVSNFVTNHDPTRAAHTTGPQLYQSILKKYGVSDSVFQASLAYYKAHPKEFLPMLDSLSQQPDLAPTAVADTIRPLPIDSVPKAVPVQTTPGKRASFSAKPLAY